MKTKNWIKFSGRDVFRNNEGLLCGEAKKKKNFALNLEIRLLIHLFLASKMVLKG